MPKLLVPTDFSKGSAVAARFAIKLAGELGLSVEFLHAYQVGRPAGSLVNVEDHMEAGVQADFSEFFESLRQNVDPKVNLHKRTMKRNAVDAISYITRLEGDEVRAVVMGTHGQTPLEQIFVGSTTRKVIQSITHPVLAIPPNVTEDTSIPTRVMWALDGKTNADDVGVRLVRELIGKPGGQLTFYYAGDDQEAAGVQADILAGDAAHNLYVTGIEGEADDEIADAVTDTKSELLVMTHRDRGLVASWLGGSTTAKVLRQTRVPILVLHP